MENREQRWIDVYQIPFRKMVMGETTKSVAFLEDIMALPEQDVQPVRYANWVDAGNNTCKCSNCERIAWLGESRFLYYCPKCGAKMLDNAEFIREALREAQDILDARAKEKNDDLH